MIYRGFLSIFFHCLALLIKIYNRNVSAPQKTTILPVINLAFLIMSSLLWHNTINKTLIATYYTTVLTKRHNEKHIYIQWTCDTWMLDLKKVLTTDISINVKDNTGLHLQGNCPSTVNHVAKGYRSTIKLRHHLINLVTSQSLKETKNIYIMLLNRGLTLTVSGQSQDHGQNCLITTWSFYL